MKIENDTYYHLFNRGNNKGQIFFEEENYSYFLLQFKKHISAYCEVYAYCLMPNHFHLFLKVVNSESFNRGIKNFFISYVKAINKRYNRVGSLFQGRYKVSEVKSDDYYTRIITYIHQNPVVARIAKTMEDYKYSSYNSYILNADDNLLNKSVIFDWFGSLDNFIEAHQQAPGETT